MSTALKAMKWSASLVGLAAFGAYCHDSRASIYPLIVMPALHLLDPEESHNLSIKLLKYGLSPKDTQKDDERLSTSFKGMKLSNPIGVAAGYDKNGEAIDGLFDLGFGMVEIGSVTPKPQPGNPLPRFFRLPKDKAVINRYGFNSDGHETVFERMMDRISSWMFANVPKEDTRFSLRGDRLLGVNLGKNKTSPADSHQDYVDGVKTLGQLADYIVINISSPNTPGLRALQRREPIQNLLSLVKKTRDEQIPHQPPLLVKIAPDCNDEELVDIAAVVQSVGIDDLKTIKQFGGLSGAPLKPLAIKTVSKFYKLTEGKIPIIGAGGISSAKDALEFAKAGASLVQLYTSLGYKGPGLVREIKDDLRDIMVKENKTWNDYIGLDHKK